MEKIVIGQRWISGMEPGLGLGIVTGVDSRSVHIWFPAGECERHYALASAPLKRVLFQTGDTVKSHTGHSFVVRELHQDEELVVYIGDKIELPESELSDSLSFTTPHERLLNGFIDDNKMFDLRFDALRYHYRIRRSAVRGFIGGRIDLIPHQLYVAREVAGRPLPRVLLSDEVGLGKTIEACLIMHRLILSDRVRRVLIVVPQSLVHQWFVELLRRFNLLFRIFDEAYCRSVEKPDANINPFLETQWGICSIEFLIQGRKRRTQAVQAGWDLVIMDEVHHIQEDTVAYRVAEELGGRTAGLLLLTATPEQLGHRNHFSRLHLLDPARYFDFEHFEHEEREYEKIAQLVNHVLEEKKLSAIDHKILAMIDTEVSRIVAKSDTWSEENRARILRELLDRFGVGRAVFRNRRTAVSGFPEREVFAVALPADEERLQQNRQAWQIEMDGGGTQSRYDFRSDPRILWLVDFLEQSPDEKVLLIAASQAKACAVEEALREKTGIQTTLFHEGLSLIQRDRNAAWFGETDGPRLMICSEIGSEGRNFQFAHRLVLFDLPLNPELLEQRIGRLDRIGQQQTVKIFVPYLIGSPAEILFRWYHEGLNAFCVNVPGAYRIFQRFEKNLRERIFDQNLQGIANLIAKTRQETADVRRIFETGRDRLLEISSFDPLEAVKLIEDIRNADVERDLERFMFRVFDRFEIMQEKITERCYHLNFTLLNHQDFPVPPMNEEHCVITFDRAAALKREDIEFLTWDHPMVTGTIEMLLGSEMGNSCLARWASDGLPGLILECILILESVAPQGLNIDRFLPPTPIRVLVDHQLKDCSADYPAEVLRQALNGEPAREILQNKQLRRELFPAMLRECNELAEKRAGQIRQNALKEMQGALGPEIERLIALQGINSNIGPETIEYFRREAALLEKHIGDARLRLDAVRLIYKG